MLQMKSNFNKYCVLYIDEYSQNEREEEWNTYKTYILHDMFELTEKEYFLKLEYIRKDDLVITFTHVIDKEHFIYSSNDEQECINKMETLNMFM